MNREIILDKTVINDDSDCYVIAEIGHNHQGSMEKAKDLIRAAQQSGANAVKLQKRDNKELFTKDMFDSLYEHQNSYGETYGLHREYLEFDKEQFLELAKFSQELGITFFATPFDFNSADMLNEINMPFFKIASADLTNVELLKHVARFNKPMIISTGGAALADVERAYNAIMPINTSLSILQCTAAYPCEFSDLNLNVIRTYKERFEDVVIGLSSHDNGIAMGPVAYMLGARIIEKHFTLNRAWKGTDHAFSLEQSGLSKLVRDLKRTRVALGNGQKRRLPCEEKPLYKMAKKIVAAADLPEGHVLTRQDLAFKCPGNGVPPYEIEKLIGKKLAKSLESDENLCFELLVD
jgi:sialic acid synthase